MESTGDAFSSLGSLSSLLDAQISESSTRIDALLNTARSLVPASDFDALTKEAAQPTPVTFDESKLISELDKTRLELLMEIQKQDYVADKLQEMIGENEDLIRSIVEYYDGAEERDQLQKDAGHKLLTHYTEGTLGETNELLQLNSNFLEDSYLKAVKDAHDTLTSILEGYEGLLSPKYGEDLNELVLKLNVTFNSLTNGN